MLLNVSHVSVKKNIVRYMQQINKEERNEATVSENKIVYVDTGGQSGRFVHCECECSANPRLRSTGRGIYPHTLALTEAIGTCHHLNEICIVRLNGSKIPSNELWR